MKQKQYIIFIFLLLNLLSLRAQAWMPDTAGSGYQIVRHEGYTLAYDECHEQAAWVAYLLTRERVMGTYPRKDRFEPDTMVVTGSSTLEDYRGSGYDRGHLAPAADMKWSSQAMRESFLMSNMSPQLKSFNDGIWRIIEEQVRSWAMKYDSLWIVTGPVLKYDLETIGKNRVSVPEYFYKVVYSPNRNEAIGILIKHENSKRPLRAFAVPIDEIEKVTGIDFFPGMPNESDKEAHPCIDCWNWSRKQ